MPILDKRNRRVSILVPTSLPPPLPPVTAEDEADISSTSNLLERAHIVPISEDTAPSAATRDQLTELVRHHGAQSTTSASHHRSSHYHPLLLVFFILCTPLLPSILHRPHNPSHAHVAVYHAVYEHDDTVFRVSHRITQLLRSIAPLSVSSATL